MPYNLFYKRLQIITVSVKIYYSFCKDKNLHYSKKHFGSSFVILLANYYELLTIS